MFLIVGQALRLPKPPATEAVVLQINEAGNFVCQRCVQQMHDHRWNLISCHSAIRSRYSFSATALLCTASFAAKRRVTVRFLDSHASFSTSSACWFSSAAYFFLNSTHLAGSCMNHFRRPVLGAISLSHSSIRAPVFFKPRGQSRSTNTRKPSDFAGSSYTRLTFRLTPSYRMKSFRRLCSVDRARDLAFS